MSNNVFNPFDFELEVRKGNVPGTTLHSVSINSPHITNGLLDVWGNATDLVYPTGVESWEIVSTSANDTITAGTGAQAVQVIYLDASYVEKTVVVLMNGTTPVSIADDCFRPRISTVGLSGSSQNNEGKITIQVAGAGAVRGVINIGLSQSLDTFITVPAGKSLFVRVTHAGYPKNEDGIVSTMIMPTLTNTWITLSNIEFYQSAFSLVQTLPMIPEKTDVKFQASSTNAGPIDVSLIIEYYLVENTA